MNCQAAQQTKRVPDFLDSLLVCVCVCSGPAGSLAGLCASVRPSCQSVRGRGRLHRSTAKRHSCSTPASFSTTKSFSVRLFVLHQKRAFLWVRAIFLADTQGGCSKTYTLLKESEALLWKRSVKVMESQGVSLFLHIRHTKCLALFCVSKFLLPHIDDDVYVCVHVLVCLFYH